MIDVTTPVLDIKLNQKASFSIRIQINDSAGNPVDISNWQFSADIKTAFKDAVPLTSFSIEVLPGSWIKLSLLPSQTAALTRPKYFYDIVALNVLPAPDEAYRMLQGTIEVSPGITGPVGP